MPFGLQTSGRRSLPRWLCLILAGLCWSWLLPAQQPQLTNVQRLANHEISMTVSGATGLNYRVEGASALTNWSALLTFPPSAAFSLQFTDSAAPFLPSRSYRALQLSGPTNFTGDYLSTADGDAIFHPVGHASLVMTWNGRTIYNDPTNGAGAYQSFPRPDLILISHDHTDHFNGATIDA